MDHEIVSAKVPVVPMLGQTFILAGSSRNCGRNEAHLLCTDVFGLDNAFQLQAL